MNKLININKLMNQLINRAVFIILSVILTAVFVPAGSQAEPMEGSGDATMSMMRKKRYRYRKRHHRVQLSATGIFWHTDRPKSRYMDVGLLYGYNFGYFEMGPSVNVWSPGNGDFRSIYFNLGGWAEFNFIKNTRKQKFVPALGLESGYLLSQRRLHHLVLSPYVSFKYFVASRTGIVLNVYFEYFTQFIRFFKNRQQGIGLSLSYVHYFHW